MPMTLKAARINAGLHQTDVANALNVNRKTISSWENGKSMPKANQVSAICELFNISYDDITWKR